MSSAKHKKNESMKAAQKTPEMPNASEPAKHIGASKPNEENGIGSIKDQDFVNNNSGINADIDTDVNTDTDIDTGTDPNGNDDVTALRKEIEVGKDRYLRLMAEFDNYKRRVGKEHERMVSAANEKLILEMVDVRENFERALKSGGTGGEFAPFYEGMKLIFAKYDEVLARNGLTPFAEAGEQFDPMIHEALMKAPHSELPEDSIAEVFERGYRLKEKVIKHARVVVSSGSAG